MPLSCSSMYDGPRLFVAGTDTGVGKTYVSTLLLKAWRQAGFRVGAYKPACSGAVAGPEGVLSWEDVDQLHAALGRDVPKDRVCPQWYAAPLAPPLAAKKEGRSVDRRLLRDGLNRWAGEADLMLIEGAGGVMSPLAENDLCLDLAADLKCPVLVVARPTLGTINHTLLTLAALRLRKIPVAGVVFSQSVSGELSENDWQDNAAWIARTEKIDTPSLLRWNAQELPDEFVRRTIMAAQSAVLSF